LIAILATTVPGLAALSFGTKLALTGFGTMVVWIPVMFLTGPEPAAVLDEFYRRARPGGPGWRLVRERTGIAPASPLARDLAETAATLTLVLGAMLGIGGLVVGSAGWAAAGTGGLVAGLAGRTWLRRRTAGVLA
jgi:hypothetical protein